MADFAKLFAPGGLMDRFFAQNLASLIDMTGQDWSWKQDARFGARPVEVDAERLPAGGGIRNAFFPSGGSVPSQTVTFTPFSLHGRCRRGGARCRWADVQSNQAGNAPSTVTWPSGTSLGVRQSEPDAGDARPANPPSSSKAVGVEAAARQGDHHRQRQRCHRALPDRRARRHLYIQTGSGPSPFFLPALSGFSCPKAF